MNTNPKIERKLLRANIIVKLLKNQKKMQEQNEQQGVKAPDYSEEDQALAKEWAQALPDAEHPGYVPKDSTLNPNVRF